MFPQSIWLPLAIGTLVCACGLIVRRPRSAFDWIRPHVVVPLAIWVAVFSQVLIMSAFGTDSYGASYGERTSREIMGSLALTFVTLCVAGFWLGYMLPVGPALARRVGGSQVAIRIQPASVKRIGYAMALLAALLAFATAGMRLFSVEGASPLVSLPDVMGPPVAIFVTLAGMAAAGMIGWSWPCRIGDDPLGVAMRLVFLFVASVPLMGTFSRGSGIPAIVAAIAYIVRYRRISILGVVLAILWALLCSDAALSGRGVYGHYSGVPNFLTQFFTHSLVNPGNVLFSSFFANDSFTPVCVAMNAVSKQVDLHQLTVLQWLLFQIPIPRVLGLQAEWTYDLTLFVGGAGSWGYTSTMMGDAFVHLGWLGALAFVPIGICYRFVDRVTLAAAAGLNVGGENSNNPLIFMLFASYFALAMGLFNSYRAWVVAFFFPWYACLAVIAVMQLFVTRVDALNHAHGEHGQLLG